MANNTNATNCTIRYKLYLTIELDDRKDILTSEKKIMCQIFRSSQKKQGKPAQIFVLSSKLSTGRKTAFSELDACHDSSLPGRIK